MAEAEHSQVTKLLTRPIRISKVFIHGLLRTKDDFAKDLSRKIFEAQTIEEFLMHAQEVQAKFNSLNVTKGVLIKLDVSDDGGDDLHVHLNLTEKKRFAGSVTGFLGNEPDAKVGVGGGVNSNGLFPNVFGRGEKISCCWQQALSHSEKNLNFQKPIFGEYSSVSSASFIHYTGDVLLSGYKEDNMGVSLNLTIPHGDLNHKLSWSGMWRQMLPLRKASWLVREHAGHSLKSSLKYELVHDTRDDFHLPSEGSLLKLSQEIAGLGGDCNFYSKQLSFQLNKQFTTDDRVVLQVGAGLGHIQPLDIFKSNSQKPLSILDKFFLGGPTSLRGFYSKGIGPREQSYSLGADFYWQAYANIRVPLPGVRGGILDRFRPQVFVNCGNCMNWTSGISLEQHAGQQMDTMRLTYGAGLVTNFLGAKMELNYCIPAKYQPQDQVQHGFQFGISVGD